MEILTKIVPFYNQKHQALAEILFTGVLRNPNGMIFNALKKTLLKWIKPNVIVSLWRLPWFTQLPSVHTKWKHDHVYNIVNLVTF